MGLRNVAEQKMKPSQLAEEIGWDIGRVSHQVSRMELKGLLEKQQCPYDARSCWIGMTKKGEALIEKAFPLQMQEVNRLFAEALTEEQLLALIDISNSIDLHLEKLNLKRA